MKIYKISQGSTIENLKHFIYITNEYGKPSSEFIDSFIENFGKIILLENLKLNKYKFDELDRLWLEIEQDCKDNQIECHYNYGGLFYYIIGNKAVDILRNAVGEQRWRSESQENQLKYLKTFIENFDNYILDGVDMQEVYLENTPDLIKKDENNEEYIDIKRSVGGGNIVGRLYKDKVIVLKGSNIMYIKPSAYTTGTRLGEKIEELRKGNIQKIDDSTSILLKNIKFKSPSGAMEFAYGATANGWLDWVNINEIKIDMYRYKDNTVDNKPVQEETKKYRLNEEYRSKGDTSLINCIVDFNNEVGTIVSDTEININNRIINIGEYISNNKIDINTVTIGGYFFNEVYEQV